MEYNKRTKILFVDDMSVCCDIVMKGLSGKYSMCWTNTKQEALQQINKNKYDLVITDFELGEDEPTGGLEVIKEAYKKHFPVVSISMANHRKEVEGLGLCKFIFKKEFFNNIEGVISDILNN